MRGFRHFALLMILPMPSPGIILLSLIRRVSIAVFRLATGFVAGVHGHELSDCSSIIACRAVSSHVSYDMPYICI